MAGPSVVSGAASASGTKITAWGLPTSTGVQTTSSPPTVSVRSGETVTAPMSTVALFTLPPKRRSSSVLTPESVSMRKRVLSV